ncbi:hypothetical protein B0H12DRAFT_1238809 [Mycena haematopus]|nr:hypothetical protein B0H12DRAFT_1238809 [Mycena haematopus]
MATTRNNSDWRTWVRFDGTEYYVMTRARKGKGKGPLGPQSLVIDDETQKEKAMKKAEATAFSSCEEVYLEKDDLWLLILHSSQTAWYPVQQNDTEEKAKRKLYWTYIAAHPAHAEKAKSMAEVHKQAVLYLKWCSFEALTSTTAKTPFPLKHSNDLANLLASLCRDSVGSDQGIQHETEKDDGGGEEQLSAGTASDDQSLVLETAAQESYQLRITLIAKILMEKYNQLYARDTSEIKQSSKPSRTLDVLFSIVDVASLGSFLRYLHRLDEVRDTLLTDDKWQDHIWRLVKEWEEFNLISTVLLSASAGILALNNIGGVPRTAILISILSSFGGITTGLYCITMYQPRAPNSRESIDRSNAMTMFKYNQYTLTHKGIALVLGLPMAFLAWSLVAFMVGILSFNIVGTEISGHVSGVAYAVISVAAAIFILIALAFYSLSRLWGSRQGRALLNTIRNQYRHWRPLADETEKFAA